MGCGGSKLTHPCVNSFLLMLKQKTNTSKFQNNKESLKLIEKALSSDVFGGSVLLPVGAKGKKRTKANPIFDEISDIDAK